MPEWRIKYPGVEDMSLTVMGCFVNGPRESKHADIGISLSGTGEAPSTPILIQCKKTQTLCGENIAEEFLTIMEFTAQIINVLLNRHNQPTHLIF